MRSDRANFRRKARRNMEASHVPLYFNTQVVFTEVPNEIALAINITGCHIHCKGCHSPWLWSNKGTPLDVEELRRLIDENKGITAVVFMGGDRKTKYLFELFKEVRKMHLKTAWYSGRRLDDIWNNQLERDRYLDQLDYLKVGPYIKHLGGLDKKTTNQRFYKVHKKKIVAPTKDSWLPMNEYEYTLEDQTYLFQSKDNLV